MTKKKEGATSLNGRALVLLHDGRVNVDVLNLTASDGSLSVVRDILVAEDTPEANLPGIYDEEVQPSDLAYIIFTSGRKDDGNNIFAFASTLDA